MPKHKITTTLGMSREIFTFLWRYFNIDNIKSIICGETNDKLDGEYDQLVEL